MMTHTQTIRAYYNILSQNLPERGEENMKIFRHIANPQIGFPQRDIRSIKKKG
jgi:hypothetical protein